MNNARYYGIGAGLLSFSLMLGMATMVHLGSFTPASEVVSFAVASMCVASVVMVLAAWHERAQK